MRIHRCSQRYFGVEQLDQRLRHGLVGYWKFNEGSGLTACDLSGKRNHGTLINGPKWSLGREHIGNALNFDGVDDYVDCGNKPSLNITGAITIEAWMKANSLSDNRFLLSKRYATSYYIQPLSSGAVECGGKNAITSKATTPTGSVTTGAWYHVVFVYDTTVSIIRIYVNSVLKIEETGNTGGIGSNDEPFEIGRSSDYPTIPFNGLIDEVRIYNQALSVAEIQKHYAEGLEKHSNLAIK